MQYEAVLLFFVTHQSPAGPCEISALAKQLYGPVTEHLPDRKLCGLLFTSPVIVT